MKVVIFCVLIPSGARTLLQDKLIRVPPGVHLMNLTINLERFKEQLSSLSAVAKIAK
jgi:hypothetical protein